MKKDDYYSYLKEYELNVDNISSTKIMLVEERLVDLIKEYNSIGYEIVNLAEQYIYMQAYLHPEYKSDDRIIYYKKLINKIKRNF